MEMAVATPFSDTNLPGAGTLSASVLELPTDAEIEVAPNEFEVVYLVVDGAVNVEFIDGLHGTLYAGTFAHARDRMQHRLSGVTDNCRLLRIDCAFEAWTGVKTAADAL